MSQILHQAVTPAVLHFSDNHFGLLSLQITLMCLKRCDIVVGISYLESVDTLAKYFIVNMNIYSQSEFLVSHFDEYIILTGQCNQMLM